MEKSNSVFGTLADFSTTRYFLNSVVYLIICIILNKKIIRSKLNLIFYVLNNIGIREISRNKRRRKLSQRRRKKRKYTK